MIAGLLWAALGASCVLAVIGVARRSGAALLLAGPLGLGFSWASMMSVGRLVVLMPLLEIAIGAGYLTHARRRVLWLLGVVALGLYVAQLAAL